MINRKKIICLGPNNNNMKEFITTVLIFILIFLLTACNQAAIPSPSAPISPSPKVSNPLSTFNGSAPSPSIYVDILFPDGAPALNQTKELICTINTPGATTETAFNLKANLPEAFELISGQLSWEGMVPGKSIMEAIKIKFKAIKMGNYTISVSYNILKQGIPVTGGKPEIYVSISESSGQWRKYPPYNDNTTSSPGNIKVVIPTENMKTLPPPPVATFQPTVTAPK
jgi:hypothetical protein